MVIAIFIAGCFMTGCQKEDNTSEFGKKEHYLSLTKSDFDFARDWDNLSEIDKNTFMFAKQRMDITFDKNGICQTKWKSCEQVNISKELFDCFINMIALTNEATDIVYPSQWTSPRLKNGDEQWECCVVQALLYVLQCFGASSGAYALPAIDSWITTSNYYTYSYQYGMWGANNPAVLSHYLAGGYINKNALLPKSGTGSSQYLITLTGPPAHVVVFTGCASDTINYYDPQGSSSGRCKINDISDVYKATGVCPL
jgi:hypothetical protein